MVWIRWLGSVIGGVSNAMESGMGFEGFAVGAENPGLVGAGGVFPLVVD